MKFVTKLFPEIIIKTRPVRKLMVKSLAQNMRNVLRRLCPEVVVRNDWDSIIVRTPETTTEAVNQAVAEALECIPGIAQVSSVLQFELGDFDRNLADTESVWGEALAGKTFCVRVKRNGNHDFTSVELERYVGGGLNQRTAAAGVRLKDPDVVVKLEIKFDRLFVVQQQRPGLGGYPLGTQDEVMTLVSGGFDSTVAAHQMIRRGLKSHFLFFNLGGAAHENGVREVSYYLWKKYGSSHRVLFVSVPFEQVVESILTQVPDRYMGVVLKRMMMRAAQEIATGLNIKAVVTGEALSQVSSQTLPNLSHIDEVTDLLVLRPLIVTGKPDIIDQARAIGTATFAEKMPEFCGVISRKPNAACKRADVHAAESEFDWSVLDNAIASARRDSVETLTWNNQECLSLGVNTVSEPDQAVVIDVRPPAETDVSPFAVNHIAVMHIPFYSLNRRFGELDQRQQYLLYCDKGVMSKLHALHLQDAGYTNVGVYSPEP
jgi:thiamine biosynthesis protein ThiI